MNNDEARSIVRQELMRYRVRPYAELCELVDEEIPTLVVEGSSGAKYQIEVRVFWDGRPNGDTRVVGSVDDGGLRAFVPLCEDFITCPDNDILVTW